MLSDCVQDKWNTLYFFWLNMETGKLLSFPAAVILCGVAVKSSD